MLLTEKSAIAEEIVLLLSQGGMKSSELLKQVQTTQSVTRQGFYKSLAELVRQEVVVKNKQLVILNNTWVNKLHGFVETVDTHYQTASSQGSFLNLSEGESLVYHFKSIDSLDALWMHYFFLIAKKEDEPVILFTQHEWFSLCRPQAENFMYTWLKEHKRQGYSVVGSDTALDRNTTAYIKSDYMEIAYEAKFLFRRNFYTTVIGPYLINTIIDPATAAALDTLYTEHDKPCTEVTKQLNRILDQMKRPKIVIMKNKKRAEQVRRKLMKYFVFYKK